MRETEFSDFVISQGPRRRSRARLRPEDLGNLCDNSPSVEATSSLLAPFFYNHFEFRLPTLSSKRCIRNARLGFSLLDQLLVSHADWFNNQICLKKKKMGSLKCNDDKQSQRKGAHGGTSGQTKGIAGAA